MEEITCGFEDCSNPWVNAPESMTMATMVGGQKVKIPVCNACNDLLVEEIKQGVQFKLVRDEQEAGIQFTGIPGQTIVNLGRLRIRRVKNA